MTADNPPAKEHPILFSAPMVRALLDGTKTQTRRILQWPAKVPDWHNWDYEPFSVSKEGPRYNYRNITLGKDKEGAVPCPYGQPGDRLWVRETWAPEQYNAEAPDIEALESSVQKPAYRASFTHPPAYRWRPSIHMPRWASRILLEVVSVRVERLQDISEEDAIAEGVAEIPGESGMCRFRSYLSDSPSRALTAYESYRSLWVSINGPGSWDANPWVWVVTFKPARTPAPATGDE